MQKLQLCAAALALVACAGDSTDVSDEARRRKKDAGTEPPTTMVDAATQPPTSSSGSVTCYTEGAPGTTCTLPTHCCFSNYSSQLNGQCSDSTCSWGTIDCDGPEDCGSGQFCCATKLDWGWKLACQSARCGEPPAAEELCHPGGACSDGSCVSTYGVNYSLPRTLYVCR
jgi:hypothetical protein